MLDSNLEISQGLALILFTYTVLFKAHLSILN